MNIYSIYDSKAEAYLQPFFAKNHAVAMRMLENATRDPSSDFHNHSEDYTLFCVGEWDERDGNLFNHDANISLANAIELKGAN